MPRHSGPPNPATISMFVGIGVLVIALILVYVAVRALLA